MTAFATSTLDENPERVLVAAATGPVILTLNDSPAFVILTIAKYDRLLAIAPSRVDRLSVPADVYFDFEAPRAFESYPRPADLD